MNYSKLLITAIGLSLALVSQAADKTAETKADKTAEYNVKYRKASF